MHVTKLFFSLKRFKPQNYLLANREIQHNVGIPMQPKHNSKSFIVIKSSTVIYLINNRYIV